jgi:ubiquinone/menaquinone biosynthesis C-methylase UbiE
MIVNVKILIKKIINKFFRISLLHRSLSPMDYWEKRAQTYGKRSVLNIGHTDDEFDEVTTMQKKKILPVLKQQLQGDEKIVLDFGCGAGRFTKELAEIIKGNAIGIDPVKNLIAMASTDFNVEYKIMEEGIIPLDDNSVDIIWVCLVMGGITSEKVLAQTVSEMERVLKTGGMLFLVENTSDKASGQYWKFRTVEFYQHLFPFVKLNYLSDYYDFDERISIMAGI